MSCIIRNSYGQCGEVEQGVRGAIHSSGSVHLDNYEVIEALLEMAAR